jgi:hypothetical protein
VKTNTAWSREGKMFVDSEMDFGSMHLAVGRSYPDEQALDGPALAVSDTLPVQREFVRLNGMSFIVESVPVDELTKRLTGLRPIAADTRNAKFRAEREVAQRARSAERAGSPEGRSGTRQTPISLAATERPARTESAAFRMRQRSPMDSGRKMAGNVAGYVLDWDLEAGSLTDYRFYSDVTYFVKGYVSLYGTTVFEPCVIKLASTNNAQLMIQSGGSLLMKTDQWRPVIFTSRDDDTAGSVLAGSSGSPSGANYGNPALGLQSALPSVVSNVRVRYATKGLYFYNQNSGHVVRHAQLLKCNQALYGDTANVAVQNVLLYDNSYALSGNYGTFTCQNLTLNKIHSHPTAEPKKWLD